MDQVLALSEEKLKKICPDAEGDRRAILTKVLHHLFRIFTKEEQQAILNNNF